MTRAGQGISDEWVSKKLDCSHFIRMDDYLDTADCFDNVELKGGVNYFLYKSTFKGKCHYRLHNKGTIDKILINLDSIGAGIVIRDVHALPIIQKISNKEGKYFNNINFSQMVSPKHFFDKDELLNSNWTGYYKEKSQKNNIKLYVNKRLDAKGFGWIPEDIVPRNQQAIKYHKIFIPESGGSGNDAMILGRPFYGEPNSVCSYTYLVIGYNQDDKNFTKEECLSIIKYIKSKFLRYLVSVKKKTQHNVREVFQFVPLQNFTSSSDIDWTKSVANIDKQLYAKYDLDASEIALIERTIKPME